MINIVLPDGSMQEVVQGLMERAGLSVRIEKSRTKEGQVRNVDWINRVVFQRPQEIPDLLRRGVFDLGIVGQDWIAEWGYDLPILLEIPIGRSGDKPVRIVLAVSEESDIYDAKLLRGCIVATEYIELTKRFFSKESVPDVKIIRSFGNTEHKIKLGLADAIIDVTESGNSLRENNLRVIAEIMTSSIVIAANPNSSADKNKRPYLECFARLIKGAFVAERYTLIIANVPRKKLKEAGLIMGGLKSATCSKTLNDNWFALQAVVLKEKKAGIIFQLLEIGVQGIFEIRDIPLVMLESE